MRKTHERNAKGPFLLTAAEDRALKMVRAGMTHREIAEALGLRSITCANQTIYTAIGKERCMALDDRLKCGISSLATARGAIRMDGTK